MPTEHSPEQNLLLECYKVVKRETDHLLPDPIAANQQTYAYPDLDNTHAAGSVEWTGQSSLPHE